jgi:hypothetical protein
MLPLIAQVGGVSFVHIAVLIVGVAAIVALVFIALRKFNVSIPDWVVQVFWVLVVAFVIIGAIYLVGRMMGWG